MGWDQKSAMVEVASGHDLDLDLDMDTFDGVFLPFLLVATTREEKAHAEILLSFLGRTVAPFFEDCEGKWQICAVWRSAEMTGPSKILG